MSTSTLIVDMILASSPANIEVGWPDGYLALSATGTSARLFKCAH